jgi:hypothetical protein
MQIITTMIAVETNKRSPELSDSRAALEVRLQFVDGSRETFIQYDTNAAQKILERINPAHLFSQTRIVVADDYSKSVFVCSHINRIDFLFKENGFSHIPWDHADIVELTEEGFRRHVPSRDPLRLQKREQPRQVGDLLVSFLNLRMRGGSHIYLMNEILVKLPAESQSYMQRLLSKGTLGIRLAGGGHSVLNLANLISYTVYPGVAEVPEDTWIVQPG